MLFYLSKLQAHTILKAKIITEKRLPEELCLVETLFYGAFAICVMFLPYSPAVFGVI